MTITMNRDGKELTIAIEGRLDTITSPELERQLEPALQGVEKLIFDFEKLVFISSAGRSARRAARPAGCDADHGEAG